MIGEAGSDLDSWAVCETVADLVIDCDYFESDVVG